MGNDRLLAEVIAELQSEITIRHEAIGVRTENGTVTLNGYVNSFAKKQAADRAVGRVQGVRSLTSEIAIRRYAAS